mgnify:CR=1 FL=1
MTVQLDFLRHGETELGGGLRGSLDDPLTASGWQQMDQAVAVASGWQGIVSSPLQRCARFAEHLAEQRGLPIEYNADLRELHFGERVSHAGVMRLLLARARGMKPATLLQVVVGYAELARLEYDPQQGLSEVMG